MTLRMLAAITCTTLAIFLVGATPAQGDGGPPGAYVGTSWNGVVSPDGSRRYVVIGKDLAAISTHGGRVLKTRGVDTGDEYLGIPAVATDGSPGGLSANGKTLVLTESFARLTQRHTELHLVDPKTLKRVQTIKLPGAYTFDAIAPDGKTLYLTQYQSRTNPNAYAIRSYDLATEHLDRKPVLDPTEPEEEMRGYPLTRVQSADGRWNYTLYSGGEAPFVHALDTVSGTARCIDLDGIKGSRLGLKSDEDAGMLTVTQRGAPVKVVSTSSFEVSAPAPDDDSGATDGPSGTGGALLVAGLAVVAIGGMGAFLLHRRRLASA